MGYIKFPEREIVYFDKVSDEYVVDGKLYWNSNGDTLSFARYETVSDKIDLRTYNVVDGGLYSFEINEKTDVFPNDVTVSDTKFVVYWDDDQSLRIYDGEGVSQSMMERIDTISGFDSSESPYVVVGENLLFYQENQLIIQSGMSRESLQIQGLKQVMMHSDAKWIVAGVENDGVYELNIMARK